jgi:predicted DCC family thiol-disulfide oxidoreductase YuxK
MSDTAKPDNHSVPQRPVLLYDGNCAFCLRWITRWRSVTGDKIEYAPYQEAADRFPDILRPSLGESAWLVEPDGRLTGSAAGIFRAFWLSGNKRFYQWAYEDVPFFGSISETAYRTIADHRDLADAVDRVLLPDPTSLKDSYLITRAIFLRALGLVYLCAFLSLAVQIKGLVGSQGILPVDQALSTFAKQQPDVSPIQRFLQVPTLCWINSSDDFLQHLCIAGAALSGVLILGILPMPVLFLLWLFYLSLVHAGQVFLGFQWDALLLEAGFLAIFFAPLQLTLRPALFWHRKIPAKCAAPSYVVLLLLRWLLFRLMFLSGICKLIADHPPAWRDFTAMRYHYMTQPLPTWTSWFAHLAPNWFQAFSVAGVLFIEGFVPLLFFGPRRARLVACAMAVFLQLLIAATGNFGFFNLLAIVLCLLLVDDAVWARLRITTGNAVTLIRSRRWPFWVTVPLAIVLVPLSLVPSLYRVGLGELAPKPLYQAYIAVAPYELVNSYGLFQDMTTRRPELIIEGSNDGTHWLAYEFKWKPGEVTRRPRFCEPHMPRLDWQMWFAALSIDDAGQINEWLVQFMRRLQEGSPAVLDLMGTNPFPDHPPRYIRVAMYDYTFTTFSEGRQTGAWWKRVLLTPSVFGIGPP